MSYTPRPGICEDCGDTFIKTSGKSKRCPPHQAVFEAKMQQIYNARSIEKKRQKEEAKKAPKAVYHSSSCWRCLDYRMYGDCNGRQVCPDGIGVQLQMAECEA